MENFLSKIRKGSDAKAPISLPSAIPEYTDAAYAANVGQILVMITSGEWPLPEDVMESRFLGALQKSTAFPYIVANCALTKNSTLIVLSSINYAITDENMDAYDATPQFMVHFNGRLASIIDYLLIPYFAAIDRAALEAQATKDAKGAPYQSVVNSPVFTAITGVVDKNHTQTSRTIQAEIEDLIDLQYNDTRTTIYDGLSKLFNPDFLLKYNYDRLDEANVEGRKILLMVHAMARQEDKMKLLSILATSFFGYVENKTIPTEEHMQAVVAGDEVVIDPNVAHALTQPALQQSPYRILANKNDSLTNPIVNIVMPPDASTGGAIITAEAIVPRVINKTMSWRMYAECDMLKIVKDNIRNYKMSQDQMDVVDKSALFVISNEADFPEAPWTRATVKLLKNELYSNTKHTDISGVSCYTLRSGNPKKSPQSVYMDPILSSKLYSVPSCAYGSEKAGIFMVLNWSVEGGRVIKKYTDALKKDIEITPQSSYTNYYAIVRHHLKNVTPSFNFNGTDYDYESLLKKFGGRVDMLSEYNNSEFVPKLRKVFAVNQAVLTAIAEELSFGGVHVLPMLCVIREMLHPDVASVTAINCHEILEQLGYNIVNSDGNIGQDLYGNFIPLPKTHKKNHQPLDVRHGYKSIDAERLDAYSRRVVQFPPMDNTKKNMLVDLTVNGHLYNPQNEDKYKKREDFKGSKLLIGDFEATCLYTIDQLITYDVFAVYIGPKYFMIPSEGKELFVLEMRKLFKNHHCTIAPTNVNDWWGCYLVGIKNDLVYGVGGFSHIPKFKFGDLARSITAMTVLKVLAVVGGMGGYVPNPHSIYREACSMLVGYNNSLKALRIVRGKPIGTKEAYMDYVGDLEMNKKKFLDVSKLATIVNYYDEGVNYQGIADSNAMIDEIQKLINDVKDTPPSSPIA